MLIDITDGLSNIKVMLMPIMRRFIEAKSFFTLKLKQLKLIFLTALVIASSKLVDVVIEKLEFTVKTTYSEDVFTVDLNPKVDQLVINFYTAVNKNFMVVFHIHRV